MGAWGSGPLDNDDAADFIGGLSQMTDSGSVAMILSAVLFTVTSSDGYLDATDMSRAMAAATVVAVMSGAPAPQGTSLQREWLDAVSLRPSDALREEALRTFERGLDPTDNEWFEVWLAASLVDEVAAALAPFHAALK